MSINPRTCWDNCLNLIRENVTEQQFNTWFRPLAFESYKPAMKTLLVQVPSPFVYEYLEENYLDMLSRVLTRIYGKGVRLTYKVVTDKANNISQNIEADPVEQIDAKRETSRGNQSPTVLDGAPLEDVDSQLDIHKTFATFIEGDSNKLPRSIGLSIAEHPNSTQFNPMFIYGPSGCGKTHLINAIGMRAKQLYPKKRVLYISARLFQVQYTNSVLQNTTNDFINFYQSIDMLIVDDVQEWMSATKTQDTFFHIFNHLFRNGMNDRLLTRFACGLIAELERPNVQLCVDILNNKIHRDGLSIPADVVQYIAQTANGSVRSLQGVIDSLMAYSIVYNSTTIDMRLAERVIKRAVKIDDKPLTVDDIMETVCHHFNVPLSAVSSRSRKRELVVARQVSMYLAQKYTKMPASRIGKLVGGRDHSTVIHSCSQVEQRLKVDKAFGSDISSIENSFKLKTK